MLVDGQKMLLEESDQVLSPGALLAAKRASGQTKPPFLHREQPFQSNLTSMMLFCNQVVTELFFSGETFYNPLISSQPQQSTVWSGGTPSANQKSGD